MQWLFLKEKILKINSIFWIFLIISALFGGGVFVYKVVERIHANQWIDVYTASKGLPYNTFNFLRVGDEDIYNNKKVAEILNMTLLKTGEYVDVLFKIKLLVTLDEDFGYIFKNKRIVIGDPLDLYISKENDVKFNVKFKSWVSSIGTPHTKFKKTVSIKMRIEGVEEWYLSKLEIGDVETDPSGFVIGEIVSREVTKSEKSVFNPFTNKIEIKEDLLYYDILLNLDLLVEEIGGKFYYDRQEVAPGKYVYIKTNRFIFRGLIDSVEA